MFILILLYLLSVAAAGGTDHGTADGRPKPKPFLNDPSMGFLPADATRKYWSTLKNESTPTALAALATVKQPWSCSSEPGHSYARNLHTEVVRKIESLTPQQKETYQLQCLDAETLL